jgi:hypothetical protein
MNLAPTIILVPFPVPVAASWLDRYNKCAPREPKSPARWPLRQEIPQPDHSAVRELVDRGRRILADERERAALRELERVR